MATGSKSLKITKDTKEHYSSRNGKSFEGVSLRSTSSSILRSQVGTYQDHNNSTNEKRSLTRLYKTRNLDELLLQAWYVQYQLPPSSRIDNTESGFRGFTFPVRTLLLPVIRIFSSPDITFGLSDFWFWKRLIEPSITDATLMLETFQSKHRMQPVPLQGIIFRRRLTNLTYCKKLGYTPFDFPDAAPLIDVVCPDSGQVTPTNIFTSTT